MIDQYSGISPKGDLVLLKKLGDRLRGRSFLNVNSTREGGGVAEILRRLLPMLDELGVKTRWEVISGDAPFFDTTKKIHNALQGRAEDISEAMWRHHFEVNEQNSRTLDLEADVVFIHDPQPAPLIAFRKAGHWIWRCHIDISNPAGPVWDRLRTTCEKYEAAVFSVDRFAKPMPIDEFIFPPSIDPISEKNRDLTDAEIQETRARFQLDTDRPILLQVSRFDRFKDPLGVIDVYRGVKHYNDCLLVLAGSPASDDPEGAAVLQEVQEKAGDDPDIRILLLPPFSDRDINALQRLATVVLQKSVKEGFGLTVSESMWKGKPVIGGATGGIPLQILHGVTGFLVHSVEGAAFRARQLLNNPDLVRTMGERAREHVRENFLITRNIRDYLALAYLAENKGQTVLEL